MGARKGFECAVVFILLLGARMFAQNAGGIAIQYAWDAESYAQLDSDAKTSGNVAYKQFMQSLMKEPQIRIREQSVDDEMRRLQLKSQIEAASSMASDDSAYAQEKSSRAALALRFSMSKVPGGKWVISALISDPETMDAIASPRSEPGDLASVTDDVVVDRLAYDVLMALQTRGYINAVSVDVANQLLHQKNTEENFQKYIESYAKQAAEADAELKALQEKNLTAEERLAAEAQEQALRLKKEMAEKNRLAAEENMRRQKEENDIAAKRQAELDKYTAEQRSQVLQYEMQLAQKQNEIRKQTLATVSLKKRIELIESNRDTLRGLERQLAANIAESNGNYEKAEREEIEAKNKSPWRTADLSNGKPTEAAINRRANEITAISAKYDALKAENEKHLRTAANPLLEEYRLQIKNDTAALEKQTYEFLSIGNDGLVLRVDAFDGNDFSWPVKSSFQPNIRNEDLSKIEFPNVKISYEMMSGKKPPANFYGAEYEEYLDLVDQTDRYFRASVPYLYSRLLVKVKYDEKTNKYVFRQQLYEIYKTENNERAIFEQTATSQRFTNQSSKKRLTGQFVKSAEEKAEIFRKTGRQGIHGSAGYVMANKDIASFRGFDFGAELLFPIHKKFRNVYFGADASYMATNIDWSGKETVQGTDYYLYNDTLYKTTGAEEKFNVASVNALIGATVTFAKFISPYVQVGAGGVFGDLSGFGMEVGGGGIDFRVWKLVIGPEAKIKTTPNGLTFFEIGLSGGFVW